tara:strand:+ start:718 stop:1773 length:1056 start_codon:yes stop_codon:yes gene_type:complete
MSGDSPQSFEIVRYLKNEKVSWNNYVDNHPQGSFFHLGEWSELIEDVFGHRSHYLVAKNIHCGSVVGVLPLVEQKSALFGHSLISTPFCVYGGAVADSGGVREALENKALEIGKSLNVDYVELRYREAVTNANYEQFCHHSTFGWYLASSREEILAQIKKKQRANVRQSLKREMNFRVDKDTNTAYEIYSESVRNLGTPVFSSNYFSQLVKYFGERVDVLTVESEGAAVSSVLSFYYKGEVLPYYGGGTFNARALKSNDLMYFELMCHALNKGCTKFDFGRSKDGSGAFKYKATWGMTAEPLHYSRALVRATEHPNLSPNNPKYNLVINTWKKLPLWITRLIGPHISKYLG